MSGIQEHVFFARGLYYLKRLKKTFFQCTSIYFTSQLYNNQVTTIKLVNDIIGNWTLDHLDNLNSTI